MLKEEPVIQVHTLTRAIATEGHLFGRPCVRLHVGCGGTRQMTSTEILREISADDMPYCIVLSGDLARQDLDSFVKRGQDMAYWVAVVTNGTAPVDWFANLDEVVLTPPAPSSGEAADLPRLSDTLQVAYTGQRFTEVSIHVRVEDDRDYAFAGEVHEKNPSVPIYLGAAGSETVDGGWPDRMTWLSQRVLDARWSGSEVRVVPHLDISF
jgi:7-carboxy-7-deazaguanine synthase